MSRIRPISKTCCIDIVVGQYKDAVEDGIVTIINISVCKSVQLNFICAICPIIKHLAF